MAYPFGLVLAGVAIISAIQHLQQTLSSYYDVVALLVVLGGTVCVSIIILPWRHLKELGMAMRILLFSPGYPMRELLSEAIAFVGKAPGGNINSKGVAGSVLREGDELISLGFSADKVQEILETRIHQSFERMHKVSNAIRSLAKYPPAFGLVGTVLGLVSLMRAVSDGLEARQTGVQMAIALTATLYGLILANLVVAPAGELLLKHISDDRKAAEIALKAVLLKMVGANALEAQELLNSYTTQSNRVSLVQAPNLGRAA